MKKETVNEQQLRRKSEEIVGLSTTKEVVRATEDTPAVKEGLDSRPRKNSEPNQQMRLRLLTIQPQKSILKKLKWN